MMSREIREFLFQEIFEFALVWFRCDIEFIFQGLSMGFCIKENLEYFSILILQD